MIKYFLIHCIGINIIFYHVNILKINEVFILFVFSDVVKNEEFLMVSFNRLLKILRSKQICFSDEIVSNFFFFIIVICIILNIFKLCFIFKHVLYF